MKRLALAPCLFLAACGGGADTSDQNVTVEVPPPATPEPTATPSDTASPEATATPDSVETPLATSTTDAEPVKLGAIAAIPAAWRGTWAGQDGCGRAATMRLRVGADRLTFFESEGQASKIERRTPRELSMVLAMTGEGDSWTRRATLTLSADGERLTRTEAGQDAVSYTRCGS